MSAELDQVSLAVTEINKVEAGLAALREQYAGVVFEVATAEGMEAAKEARRAVRDPRLEVERIRKAAKAPILALGKRLDSEAARITAELEKLEGPIHLQIKSEEDRKEAEKQAKIAAEQARVEGIQRRIQEIRDLPVHAATSPSLTVGQMLQRLEGYVIDATFAEFTPQAQDALIAAKVSLTALLAERKAQEAEQERIRLEREELVKLRAEQAERDRLAREEQARRDAEAQAERNRLEAAAKAERDAEAARQAEINRLERERIAREETDAKAIRDAEARRLADERAENERIARERQTELDAQAEAQRIANEAEQRRIAEQQTEIERQQEALRAAQAPKPKPRKAPGGTELVDVIAKHYGVESKIALGWLLKIDWKQERAA